MYYITLETTENGQKTTYSDRLLDMQEVLHYIDYFRGQDNLTILNIEIKRSWDYGKRYSKNN